MIIFLMKDQIPMNAPSENTNDLMAHVSRIVSAYIQSHKLPLEDLPTVINKVFHALSVIDSNPHSLTSRATKEPAVPVNESVHDDYIVCLEDGKKMQMLKRHLSTTYHMTLDQYKERWNLPHDYPTVSPSYARRRSSIAQKTGLGKNGPRKKSHLKVA